MGRKRIVILAGRSFTGTYLASRLLLAGKEVATIVVERGGVSASAQRGTKNRLRSLLWYLKTGEISELFNRLVSLLLKSPYEGMHLLNRWKEIFQAKGKEGTHFFFEDLRALYGVPVVSVASLNHPEAIQTIRNLSPDLLVICGTRKLKPEVLSLAPEGAINLHGSLLPKYRGLMAEFWALYHGDPDAVGITVHYADAGLDTGDIILQEKTDVMPQDTFRSLRFKNTLAGSRLVVEAVDRIERGAVHRTAQPRNGYPTFHQPSFEERQALAIRLKKQRRDRRTPQQSLALLSLVFVVSFAIRMSVPWVRGERPLAGDEISYDAAAMNLVNGKGYVTQGSNTRPPAYPFFLMVHYLMFGHLLWPAWISQALLGSLTVLLIWGIARRYLPPAGVRAAILLAMIEPAMVAGTSLLLSETLATFLLVFSIWISLRIREKATAGSCLALGGVLGLLVLIRGIMVFFPAFLLAGLAVRRTKGSWRTIFLSSLAFVVAVTPWVLRNYRVYGTPLLNSPQAGEVFYFANHPPAGHRFGVRIDDETVQFARTHFTDDVARDRFFFREGWRHLLEKPATVFRLLLLKFLMFWSPFDWEVLGGGRYNGIYGFFLPLSFAGMVFSSRRGLSLWELFSPVLYTLGMALVFYGSPRFRLPIHPLLILFSAVGFAMLWQRSERRKSLFLLGIACFLFGNGMMALYSDQARVAFRTALRWVGLWA